MSAVFLNDRPLDAVVSAIIGLEGYLSPDVRSTEVVPLANRAALFGTTVTVSPRTITVMVDVETPQLIDRATMLDALSRRLRGRMALRIADRPDREIDVVCQGTALTFYHAPLAVVACTVTLTFVAADPAWRDRDPLAYALSTSRTACPLGTAPSAPVVTLYGGTVVDPVVIMRAGSGEETGRLTLAGTLASTDAIVIDAGAQSMQRYVSGVLQTGSASGLTWLTSGVFPLLDPDDADADAAQWPTVELSATSGTPTGLLTYTRRWS